MGIQIVSPFSVCRCLLNLVACSMMVATFSSIGAAQAEPTIQSRVQGHITQLLSEQGIQLSEAENQNLSQLLLEIHSPKQDKVEILSLVRRIDEQFSAQPAKGSVVGLALISALELEEPTDLVAIENVLVNPDLAVAEVQQAELKAQESIRARLKGLGLKPKLIGFGSATVVAAGAIAATLHYHPDYFHTHATLYANGGKNLILFLTKEHVKAHPHVIEDYYIGLKMLRADLRSWVLQQRRAMQRLTGGRIDLSPACHDLME